MNARRMAPCCVSSALVLFSVSPAGVAQIGQGGDQLAAIRAACTADAQRLCATVKTGNGRIVACLKEHKDELS